MGLWNFILVRVHSKNTTDGVWKWGPFIRRFYLEWGKRCKYDGTRPETCELLMLLCSFIQSVSTEEASGISGEKTGELLFTGSQSKGKHVETMLSLATAAQELTIKQSGRHSLPAVCEKTCWSWELSRGCKRWMFILFNLHRMNKKKKLQGNPLRLRSKPMLWWTWTQRWERKLADITGFKNKANIFEK